MEFMIRLKKKENKSLLSRFINTPIHPMLPITNPIHQSSPETPYLPQPPRNFPPPPFSDLFSHTYTTYWAWPALMKQGKLPSTR